MAIQIPSDEDDHTKAIVVSNGDAKGIPNFLHALKEEDKVRKATLSTRVA